MTYDLRRPEEGSLLHLARHGALPRTVTGDLARHASRPGMANARAQKIKLRHRLRERRGARALGVAYEGSDFSYTLSPREAQCFWNAGKRVLCVYEKWTGRPSIDLYLSIGFLVWPIFETSGTDYRGGRIAGRNAALSHLAWCRANGLPETTWCRNTFDEDVLGYGLYGLAHEYDLGWNDVVGHDPTCSYGQGQLVLRLVLDGVANRGWQTYAWSAGVVIDHPQVDGYQNPNGVRVCNTDTDRDRFWRADIGAIGQRVGPPAPPAPPPDDDDFIVMGA